MINFSPCESLVNVLTPLLSSLRDALSLYWAVKAIEKSLLAGAAKRVTSRVNGSVMVRLVVPIQAIFDSLQGN